MKISKLPGPEREGLEKLRDELDRAMKITAQINSHVGRCLTCRRRREGGSCVTLRDAIGHHVILRCRCGGELTIASEAGAVVHSMPACVAFNSAHLTLEETLAFLREELGLGPGR